MWMCPSQDRYQAACARTRNAAQQPSCQTIHLPGWTCNDEQRAQENHATAIVAACSTEQGDFQIQSLGQGWPSVSLIKFSLSKENSKTYVCLGQQRERERERERERDHGKSQSFNITINPESRFIARSSHRPLRHWFSIGLN